MKISGFTIVRNAVKYNYPVLESIQSILPICDEFIINVGDSEDETLSLIQSIHSSKIRIIQNKWDLSQGKEVLSYQTNLALKECKGDWAFYLQSDEVVHEEDLSILSRLMRRYLDQEDIDCLRFAWFHFYGSYYRYRIDRGWYQKQDRIIRNNGLIQSMGDAYAFERKDGSELKRINTGCYIYHYGWVHSGEMMKERRVNAEQIGFVQLKENERYEDHDFGELNRFPVYFGTHPKVMEQRIEEHPLSQKDKEEIQRKYWWHPARMLRLRYKTWKRHKEKIT